jgi:uncharacterized protein YecT (DUF1311 family)
MADKINLLADIDGRTDSGGLPQPIISTFIRASKVIPMRLVISALALAVCFTVRPQAVQAQSFDCAKATSIVEHLICGDPGLAARDDAISRLYINALKSDKLGKVRTQQRAWVKGEQSICHEADCLRAAYDSRLTDLFAPGSPGLVETFSSPDNGGDLALFVVAGKWMVFSLNASSGTGAATNTGSETGIVELTTGKAGYKVDECVLSLQKLYTKHWKVAEGESCSGRWGLNVDLAGDYTHK